MGVICLTLCHIQVPLKLTGWYILFKSPPHFWCLNDSMIFEILLNSLSPESIDLILLWHCLSLTSFLSVAISCLTLWWSLRIHHIWQLSLLSGYYEQFCVLWHNLMTCKKRYDSPDSWNTHMLEWPSCFMHLLEETNRLTGQQQLLTCHLSSDVRRKDKQDLTGLINIPYSLGLKVVTSVKDLYM